MAENTKPLATTLLYNEIRELRNVLCDLLQHVEEDVPQAIGTSHLWEAVAEAHTVLRAKR